MPGKARTAREQAILKLHVGQKPFDSRNWLWILLAFKVESLALACQLPKKRKEWCGAVACMGKMKF